MRQTADDVCQVALQQHGIYGLRSRVLPRPLARTTHGCVCFMGICTCLLPKICDRLIHPSV